MTRKEKHSPSAAGRVLGGAFGALIGGIWALLRTWEASADYFNRQGRGWVALGVLLGWIPGLVGALAGLAYGLWEGGRRGFIDGVLATLRGVERYLEEFENRLNPETYTHPPRDGQRRELLAVDHATRARSSAPLRTPRVLPQAALKKQVRILEQHKQVRFFDPEEAPIHVGPLVHERRGRATLKGKNGHQGHHSPPASYYPSARRVATSSTLYTTLGSRKTARQLAEEAKQEKPRHPKHKRRSRSASPG
jgi:hypothetical protein